jgi:putative Holliday junction resolvase
VRTLGLDVGSKTIGLAVSDANGQIAMAQGTLRRQGTAKDTRSILDAIARYEAQTVVFGHPLELDGRRGPRALRVEAFMTALRAALEAGEYSTVEVHLWDERFSTAAAERTLLEADVSRSKRKTKIDGLAAQFILQGWLDARLPRSAEADP